MTTKTRNQAINRAWQTLCTLAALTVLAAVTGPLWALPPALLVVALTPGMLVTLLHVVAGYADLRKLSEGKFDA